MSSIVTERYMYIHSVHDVMYSIPFHLAKEVKSRLF